MATAYPPALLLALGLVCSPWLSAAVAQQRRALVWALRAGALAAWAGATTWADPRLEVLGYRALVPRGGAAAAVRVLSAGSWRRRDRRSCTRSKGSSCGEECGR